MTSWDWVSHLERWFLAHKRSMPWRTHPSPYRTWISEIMLQQTQVATVIPYFDRFLDRFPDVYTLAKAPLDDVLKVWEGLGYYSRARNLHKSAQKIVSDFDGQLPQTYASLQTLPGIGPYCAAAIASIAFEEGVPVVDGNVLRVFARFWELAEDIGHPKTKPLFFQKLQPAILQSTPSVFNQAIMELGALMCTPKQPDCHHCPLNCHCKAFEKNIVSRLPIKTKRQPIPHYTIGVGLIVKDGHVLIAKRKTTQMLGGLWEFPGGKQKPNESIEETVIREIQEETSLEVAIVSKLCVVKHAYTHFKITLNAFICTYLSGTACANASEKTEWVATSKLPTLAFPTANKKVLERFLG